MKSYSVQHISDLVKGEIVGDATQNITAPEELEMAKTGQISFIGNAKYEKLWADSKASAAVVNDSISIEPGEGRAFIKVKKCRSCHVTGTGALCSGPTGI